MGVETCPPSCGLITDRAPPEAPRPSTIILAGCALIVPAASLDSFIDHIQVQQQPPGDRAKFTFRDPADIGPAPADDVTHLPTVPPLPSWLGALDFQQKAET